MIASSIDVSVDVGQLVAAVAAIAIALLHRRESALKISSLETQLARLQPRSRPSGGNIPGPEESEKP